MTDLYECPCGHKFDIDEQFDDRYCPNCGAMIDKGEQAVMHPYWKNHKGLTGRK